LYKKNNLNLFNENIYAPSWKTKFCYLSFKVKINPVPITHEDWETNMKFNLKYQNCIYQIHHKGNVFAEPLKSRWEPQGSAERSLNANGLDTVK